MLEKKTISMRSPDTFDTIVVERRIVYTLKHDGVKQEIKKSSWDTIRKELPSNWLAGLTKEEEFVTLQGTIVYRGKTTVNGSDVFFSIEKVF